MHEKFTGEKMKELFTKINIKPKDLMLYKIAFSHSSYTNEKKKKIDYERLEFLGDAVLELVVSEYLYISYKVKEGDLTKLRASYVCEEACFAYAVGLSLSDYIKVGHGEELVGGRYKKVILADIFEALLGAIYLDLGYETVKRVVLEVIVPYIENEQIVFFEDYKSVLQEAVQSDKRMLRYNLINESGPAHNKRFTVEVKIDDILYGVGNGKSKKDAEQEAAKVALSKLAKID